MKDVPDLCRGGGEAQLVLPRVPQQTADNSHQPMPKHGKGKTLQILEKCHKPSQKQPVKMEGDKTSNDLVREQVGVAGSQGGQTFTVLQQLVEMGDPEGFTEVILHSKFCSKLNQATKPVIKHGAKSTFLHQFSLDKSRDLLEIHNRGPAGDLQALG